MRLVRLHEEDGRERALVSSIECLPRGRVYVSPETCAVTLKSSRHGTQRENFSLKLVYPWLHPGRQDVARV